MSLINLVCAFSSRRGVISNDELLSSLTSGYPFDISSLSISYSTPSKILFDAPEIEYMLTPMIEVWAHVTSSKILSCIYNGSTTYVMVCISTLHLRVMSRKELAPLLLLFLELLHPSEDGGKASQRSPSH